MNDDSTDSRWFTGATHGDISVDFTALEEATLASILAYARDPVNQDNELMHCVDSAGTRVIDTSTGQRQAVLTDTMRSAAKTEPVRFWHNHPSQDSLSHLDWTMAATSDLVEVLALNESASIFVGRMLQWRDEFALLLRQFPMIAGHLHFQMSSFAKAAGMDLANEIAFSRRTGHVLNLAMSHCNVVHYAYRLSKADATIMQVAEKLGVVARGLNFAVGEINRVLIDPSR